MIKDRMANASYGDFFTVLLASAGMGLIMSLFNSSEAFLVSYTISVTIAITSLLIFLFPRFLAKFKKEPGEKPIGQLLAMGIEGDRPRVKDRARAKMIEPEF